MIFDLVLVRTTHKPVMGDCTLVNLIFEILFHIITQKSEIYMINFVTLDNAISFDVLSVITVQCIMYFVSRGYINDD